MTPKDILVVCARRYNGHELWTLLGVLHKRGLTFEVVSTNKLIKDELTFEPNILDRLVYEVPPEEAEQFRGICVVSGNMKDTEAYWTDQHVEVLLHAFKQYDKVTAAICCSVPTLAPIAHNTKVSYFPLVRSTQRLLRYGAIPQAVSLTVDGKVVTAENQMITQMWGEEIANAVEGKPPIYTLVDSGYIPKGRPRRMHAEVQRSIDEARATNAAAAANNKL